MTDAEPPLRIGIDASAACVGQPTGVGWYIRRLVEGLASVDPVNRYVLCYRLSRLKRREHFLELPGPNFRRKIIQPPFNILFRRRLDCFHGPDLRLPDYPVPRIATVHDLAAVRAEGVCRPGFSETRSRHLRQALEADRIVTHSETVRDELIAEHGVAPERVTAVPLAPVHATGPVSEPVVRETLDQLGIVRPYVLYVGEISARKDVRGLVEWFRRLDRKELSLVLAGKDGFGAEEELAGAEDLDGRVRRLGYVPSDALPALYSGARLFAIWSREEGFGIPPLEAMACRTPVLAAGRGALPEVCGPGAVLVDPADFGAAVEKARPLLEDGAERDDRIEQGRRWVERFTWERTARTMRELYEGLGRSRHPDRVP